MSTYDTLKAEQFKSPWDYLDAKQSAFEAERKAARKALRTEGWLLNPNHPVSGRWRMRRAEELPDHTDFSAHTVDELISHAQANPTMAAQVRRKLREQKAKAKAERKAAREELKKAKENAREEKRKASAAKRAH